MRLILLGVVLVALVGLSAAADPTQGNTDVEVYYFASGYLNVTSSGAGFGGTDQTVCKTKTTETFSLPWGYPAGTTVKTAWLLYQASTNGNETSFWVTLDGTVVEDVIAVTSGTVCSRKLSKAYGLRADVTSLVESKLTATTAASVDFTVTFETKCNPKSFSNGLSLVVVAENKDTISYKQVQLAAGAFAYDIKFNKDMFTALFTIPAVGLNGRLGNATISMTSLIGESEVFINETEGFYINGNMVPLQLNGNEGFDWEDLVLDVTQYVSSSATQLNVTLFSSVDCHIFIGIALQYEVRDPSGNGSDIIFDPHAKTWDGAYVTLAEEGDFVLVESASTGALIHGRFCKARRGHWAPWTCAVAMRCAKDEGSVEISAEDFHNPAFTGVANVDVEYKMGKKGLVVTCKSTGFSLVILPDRFHRHPFLNVEVKNHHNVFDVRGLLGTPTGNAEDDFEFRDGTKFRPFDGHSHYIGHSFPELNRMQDSWRVLPEELIFRQPFEVAKGPAPVPLSRPALDARLQMARAACKDAGVEGTIFMAICEYDVSRTGSVVNVPSLKEWFTTP
mmetsp:Transcript_27589/g.47626  ORF Transcript_27589/g.47626 Transcript_27589/m.47626 type:complete len:562 (-) Transcript_27589:1168-2853(-)|eukprot:CAMPEP_0196657976 /NCGR_PEP_ID=MMETSP1086-20130531/26434_1 /TAXON_ID=77921 /ORGANISM="Cyanoptyche  gloeocystis , Strain SAG4.97" /LENGTH=561 /DNA_ID=CAMNT_0041991307 /DNA_START=33 /DNA_END=1718 /DNA_ORIENTATION=+